MSLPQTLPPAFRHWQTEPFPEAAPDGSVAYALPASPIPSTPVWQLDLSAETPLAQRQLEQVELQLAQTQRALETISPRLDQFIQQTRNNTNEGISFGAGSARALPEAESELLAWLQDVQQAPQSFALGEQIFSSTGQMSIRVEKSLEGLLQQVLHLAWVETRLEGRLLARTVVGWNGQADTIWGAQLLPNEYTLHHRSLRLAVASRVALLRLVLSVVQSALKLSLLLASPGGAALALPAAWTYVQRILAEIENYPTRSKSNQEN